MSKLPRTTLAILAAASIGLFVTVSYGAQSNDSFKPKPRAEMNGEVPEAASGEEASEAGEGEHALKSINWFDFDNKKQVPYSIYLMNFALLIALYVKLGRKPIAEGLKARRESIAKEIEDAQRMKKEAKQRAKKYQAKLEGLDDELASAKAGLIEAGKADKARIVRDAEEKAARMNKDAAALLEQETRQVHEDLVNETVEAAVREAEELLKKRVMPEDHERLAEDFLASLTKRPAPSLANPSAGGGAS
ncbi:MAG: ATP synthase F0 subunit B [Polyangiaceae bacterium]